MPIIQPVSHICQLKLVIPVYFLYPAHRVSSSTPPKVFVLSTHTVSYYIDVCNSCCNTECTNRNVWYSNSFVECGVFSGSFLFSSRTIISLISDHIPTYQCQHAMNKYLYWWRKSTPLGTWPRLVFIDVHITLYSIIFYHLGVHEDVMTWKRFLYYWLFVTEIRKSTGDQQCMFNLLSLLISGYL